MLDRPFHTYCNYGFPRLPCQGRGLTAGVNGQQGDFFLGYWSHPTSAFSRSAFVFFSICIVLKKYEIDHSYLHPFHCQSIAQQFHKIRHVPFSYLKVVPSIWTQTVLLTSPLWVIETMSATQVLLVWYVLTIRVFGTVGVTFAFKL